MAGTNAALLLHHDSSFSVAGERSSVNFIDLLDLLAVAKPQRFSNGATD
jgi:hypothetical protein